LPACCSSDSPVAARPVSPPSATPGTSLCPTTAANRLSQPLRRLRTHGTRCLCPARGRSEQRRFVWKPTSRDLQDSISACSSSARQNHQTSVVILGAHALDAIGPTALQLSLPPADAAGRCASPSSRFSPFEQKLESVSRLPPPPSSLRVLPACRDSCGLDPQQNTIHPIRINPPCVSASMPSKKPACS